MISSDQRENLKEEIVDIGSIRRETKNLLEKRVKKALDHYVKNTILGEVTYSIDTNDASIYSMYASYYFIEKTMEINNIEIVVHRQRWNDPHLEIALCHELGHLENALQSKDRDFLDPKNMIQNLHNEIMADRKAARIYSISVGKKVVGEWLKESIKKCVKDFKRAADRKTMLRSLMFFLIRYIAHILQ